MSTHNENQSRMTAAKAARTAALAGGKTPHQRGLEKMLVALDWIYRWGWASPSTIDLISGAAAHGLAARLVRRGLLIKTRTEAGGGLKGVPTWLLTLSVLGLQEVERQRKTLLPYECDPYRIRQEQLRHDQLAQSATARNLLDGKIESFQTEKELSQRSTKNTKQPDVLWRLPGGTLMGVEIELSAKWERDLDHFVLACLLALHPNAQGSSRFDQLALISDSRAIIERYSAALSAGARFRTWKKNDQRRWVIDQEKNVPEWINGRLLCKLIG